VLESYDKPWTFNSFIFDSDDIDKYVGFCYVIYQKSTGQKYLGRKYFHSIRKVKGKARRQKFESDWKKYWSSSDVVKQRIKENPDDFYREIISLHTTRGDCNYMEVKFQFQFNVLESDEWLNDNINGKWQRKPKHITESRVISEAFSRGL
jgi:hypothetical protein